MPATLQRLGADALRDTVVTYRDQLHAHAAGLNRLNVYPVPDGDTGTNMARTLDAVVAEIEAADEGIDALCEAISHGSLMGARGNSGVILSQILRGVAGTMRGAEEASSAEVAGALSAAAAGAYQAVHRPIEGTILTVAREAAEAAETAAKEGATLAEVLREARDAGRAALARTPEMLPVLKEAGVVDAGGAGYLLLLDSALHVVAGEPLPDPADDPQGPSAATIAAVSHRQPADGEVDISALRYEVMFFLALGDAHIESFKQRWGEIGDSIVVVGGEGTWNCHVHTNDIGAAIEGGLANDGRPSQIRVTDLFAEVDEEHARREALLAAGVAAAAAGLPPVTCAVVAVASGDGLVELFGQLGVQGVVVGGQTLNPSTAELLDAVNAVNARQVVVLPNNKNIVAVAEQLDGLTDKHVVVVPTASMPEGLAALVVYDPEASAEDNQAEMASTATAVATGELTQAVRATSGPAGPIAEDDWIGLVRGEGVVAAGGELEAVGQGLLDEIIGEHSELLTVITGRDAVATTTDSLLAWMSVAHPDVHVEVHRGGQPLYPYLFGVE